MRIFHIFCFVLSNAHVNHVNISDFMLLLPKHFENVNIYLLLEGNGLVLQIQDSVLLVCVSFVLFFSSLFIHF